MGWRDFLNKFLPGKKSPQEDAPSSGKPAAAKTEKSTGYRADMPVDFDKLKSAFQNQKNYGNDELYELFTLVATSVQHRAADTGMTSGLTSEAEMAAFITAASKFHASATTRDAAAKLFPGVAFVQKALDGQSVEKITPEQLQPMRQIFYSKEKALELAGFFIAATARVIRSHFLKLDAAGQVRFKDDFTKSRTIVFDSNTGQVRFEVDQPALIAWIGRSILGASPAAVAETPAAKAPGGNGKPAGKTPSSPPAGPGNGQPGKPPNSR